MIEIKIYTPAGSEDITYESNVVPSKGDGVSSESGETFIVFHRVFYPRENKVSIITKSK